MGWYDPKAMPRWSAGPWPAPGSARIYGNIIYLPAIKIFKGTGLSFNERRGAIHVALADQDPKTGYLVTNPSTSPENTIKINGKEYQLAMAVHDGYVHHP
jgi:alpha-L-fucosidase 2